MSEQYNFPSNYGAPEMITDTHADNPYSSAVVNVATDETKPSEFEAPNYPAYNPQPYIPTEETKEEKPPTISYETKSEYNLYVSKTYYDTVNDWSNFRNEPSKYVEYWDAPDSLRNFSVNSRANNKFNSLYWSIAFLFNLFLMFLVSILSWKYIIVIPDYLTLGDYSKKLLYGNLITLLFVFYLIGEQLFPFISVRYGIFITIGIHLISYFVYCKYYWTWLWLWMFLGILGGIYYFITKANHNFDISILGVVNKTFLHNAWYIVFAVLILIFILNCVSFTIYTAFGDWTGYGALSCYLVISLYFLITTFGNCFYMVSSYMTAQKYLTGANSRLGDFFFAMKRTFIFNFGIACKMAILLPLTEFIHATARYDPKFIANSVGQINAGLGEAVGKFASAIVKLAQKIAQPIMKLLGFPNRRAMIYSAVFGIEYKEAAKRYCEVSYTRGANLVEEMYMYDAQLIYKQFNMGLAVMFLCMHVISSVPGIVCAGGLFLVFGAYFSFRCITRSIAETIFVMFGEYPDGANNMHENLLQTLSEAYSSCARSRNGSTDRNSALLTELPISNDQTSPYST